MLKNKAKKHTGKATENCVPLQYDNFSNKAHNKDT